jgi:hypothetical protein
LLAKVVGKNNSNISNKKPPHTMKKNVFILAIISFFFFISCESKNKSEKINEKYATTDVFVLPDTKILDEYDVLKKKLFQEYIEKERIAFIEYYIKRQTLLIRLAKEKGLSLDLNQLMFLEEEIPNDIFSDKKYKESEEILYEEYKKNKQNAYEEYSHKECLLSKAQQKNKQNAGHP